MIEQLKQCVEKLQALKFNNFIKNSMLNYM